jgi:2-aminoadipate transaminase
MAHAHRSFVREILKVTEDPRIISFAGGLPNPRLFPVEQVARAAEAVLSESGAAALQYAPSEGYRPLREYIARRYQGRGLGVQPEDVLVTTGSQQGLDLIAKVLLDAGSSVVVERPTYLAAIQAFGLFEPVFTAVPMDEEGVDTAALAAALSRGGVRLVYAVPNFQNPSGISWSPRRRREAAALLAVSGAVFVEDDPYGELRFAGTASPPVGRETDGAPAPWAVHLGTFSKTVAPGLRVGWLVASPPIMEKVVVAKQAADLHSGGLDQRILHRYVTDNDVDAHIARIRDVYGRHRDLMVALAQSLFPPEVQCTKPEGGMFLWMTLPEGISSMDLFDRAIREGVAFVPGQAFYTDGKGTNTMRLNFSNADEPMIEEGMRRLARVFAGMTTR